MRGSRHEGASPRFDPELLDASVREATLLVHPREAELLRRDGWAMRSVMLGGCAHEIADHRTVGLPESCGHPNLHLYFPLPGTLPLDIFQTAVELVQQGKKFEDGERSSDILHGFEVKFVASTIGGIEHLRMILPDKCGELDAGRIAEPYARQYRHLHDLL